MFTIGQFVLVRGSTEVGLVIAKSIKRQGFPSYIIKFGPAEIIAKSYEMELV